MKFLSIFFYFLFLATNSISSTEVDPCTIVIFGITGDLASRKLLPSINELSKKEMIAQNTVVVGFSLKDAFFYENFEKPIFYVSSDFNSDEGYAKLKELLEKNDREFFTSGNTVFYLSTAPKYFAKIIKKLSMSGCLNSENRGWKKVIIEKPFGQDLATALDLQKHIKKYLNDDQVYLIDHYLGKEGVQNLLKLRCENSFFECLLNREFIENVQITLSEDIGIGVRASFWEGIGCLRDVVQNHLIQILSILAMELPLSLDETQIHKEKIKVINTIRPFLPKEIDQNVVCGQYDPGWINGKKVLGYLEEEGVLSNSMAETYVAVRLFIDNPRWKDVPFYVRAGKRLSKKTTEIAITFKNSVGDNISNILFIRIQPDPAIFFNSQARIPFCEKVPMTFEVVKSSIYEYEKLIYDCIKGDHRLYVDLEEHMAAWRLFDPVLKYWKEKGNKKIHFYEAGTSGPVEAELMLMEQGHYWQGPENI